MALEEIGSSLNVERLKERLKKRFPDHNFDIPPEPDRTCKARAFCNSKDKPTYYDQEGNIYCGLRYKQADANDPYKWDWRECHALIKEADKQKEYWEQQEDIF